MDSCTANRPPSSEDLGKMDSQQLYVALQFAETASDSWTLRVPLGQPVDPCMRAWAIQVDTIRAVFAERVQIERLQMQMNALKRD